MNILCLPQQALRTLGITNCCHFVFPSTSKHALAMDNKALLGEFGKIKAMQN